MILPAPRAMSMIREIYFINYVIKIKLANLAKWLIFSQ
jgi:hypothetical protein